MRPLHKPPSTVHMTILCQGPQKVTIGLIIVSMVMKGSVLPAPFQSVNPLFPVHSEISMKIESECLGTVMEMGQNNFMSAVSNERFGLVF